MLMACSYCPAKYWSSPDSRRCSMRASLSVSARLSAGRAPSVRSGSDISTEPYHQKEMESHSTLNDDLRAAPPGSHIACAVGVGAERALYMSKIRFTGRSIMRPKPHPVNELAWKTARTVPDGAPLRVVQ